MRYQIKVNGKKNDVITAESAELAIEKFASKCGLDSDLGFLHGGLVYDLETRGGNWARINSDGGIISAEKIK